MTIASLIKRREKRDALEAMTEAYMRSVARLTESVAQALELKARVRELETENRDLRVKLSEAAHG